MTRCSPEDGVAGFVYERSSGRRDQDRFRRVCSHEQEESFSAGQFVQVRFRPFAGPAQVFFRSRLLREQAELSANIESGLEKEKQLGKSRYCSTTARNEER